MTMGRKKLAFNGHSKTMSQWTRHYDMPSWELIYIRVQARKAGEDPDQATLACLMAYEFDNYWSWTGKPEQGL